VPVQKVPVQKVPVQKVPVQKVLGIQVDMRQMLEAIS
jgi:hypothetical protein